MAGVFALFDLGEEGPLEAGGEARAAAAAELGLLDLFGHGVGLHRQGFAEARRSRRS
jgi:hypothetical protein